MKILSLAVKKLWTSVLRAEKDQNFKNEGNESSKLLLNITTESRERFELSEGIKSFQLLRWMVLKQKEF